MCSIGCAEADLVRSATGDREAPSFEADGMLLGRVEEARRSRVKGRLRVYAAWRSFP
jgi:hypothetical protein